MCMLSENRILKNTNMRTCDRTSIDDQSRVKTLFRLWLCSLPSLGCEAQSQLRLHIVHNPRLLEIPTRCGPRVAAPKANVLILDCITQHTCP